MSNSSDVRGSSEYADADPSPLALDVTFLVLTIAIGLSANLLTILSVTRFKQLKSATNFLVVNIGLADLLVCAYFVPTILANRIAERNVFNDIACRLNAFLLFTAAGVSNFSFTLIAVSRNLCVLSRILYQRYFTDVRVIGYCVVCWLIWFMVSGIFWWQEGFGYIPEVFICFYYDDESFFALSFLLTLLGVAFPSLIAAGCYIRLFVRLFLIRNDAEPSLQNDSASASKEWKALVPVLAAYTAFNLCWGPYSIHVYIDRFLVPVDRTLHKALIWLAVFNSALNPIIYASLNPQFRRSYARIARRILCVFKASAVGPSSLDQDGRADAAPQF